MRFLMILLTSLGIAAVTDAADYKAGVAVKVITPPERMWMAGYAARNRPAEGKQHDLYVKALALEDAAGGKLVLVTSDLIGIPRDLSVLIADDLLQLKNLRREQLMLTASHTHCGPVLRDNLIDMYDMPPAEAAKIRPYSDKLRGWIVETVVAALNDLKPAQLSVGRGTARFAGNRREPSINGYNASGPVDHAVPVLRVAGGKLRAVVFGYACHNTTLDNYLWSGDYAGFSQIDLEAKHPGCVAMFWSGCGADANPLPRRTVALCRQYGRDLADAVDDVLAGPMTPVSGTFAARYAEIELPFDTPPAREKLAAEALSKQVALRRRAERLLKTLDAGGKIDASYRHYPIQAWRLGDGPLWLALGGEVVVDYALRLKRELRGGPPLWVTAYANDVMAYIPSMRVLKEGGYEGDTSMIYYGMPTKWAPPVEEKIVGKVHALVRDLK